MKIRDIANLSDYLPDGVNLDADINDLCIVDTENYVSFNDFPPGTMVVKHSPLTWAIKLELSGVVKQLLENGANPNIKDSAGRSPLRLAHYKPEIARLLIAAGADLTATDSNGNTALDSHVAGSKIDAAAFARGFSTFNPTTYPNMVPLLSAIHNNFEYRLATILESMGMRDFGSLKPIAQYIADYANFDEKFSSCWNSLPKFAQSTFKAYCKTAAAMDSAFNDHTAQPFLIAYTASKRNETNSANAVNTAAQANPDANTAVTVASTAKAGSTH